MFRVEKIRLDQLSEFIESDVFKLLEDKPISSLRVISYLNNPNGKPEDIVLYMAFDKTKLVGYRTIWRDVYSLVKEKSESFGWLSGNWVHIDYRRKGISTLLFNEVYKDWNKALMYTNYAINSKLLYDKTGLFQEVKSLVGIRFYLRFCTADVLVRKHKIFSFFKIIFLFLDNVFNFIFDVRFWFFNDKKRRVTTRKDEEWTAEMDFFLQEFKEKEFFKRGKKRYKWIQDFPWIKTNENIKNESVQYQFSLFARNFKNNYYTFYNEEKKLKAFVWLSFRDGHLKIPYAYFHKEQLDEVIRFIITECKKKKVKTIVVYNSEIEKHLKKKLSFLTKKAFYQNFYATTSMKLNSDDIKNKEIQSGNGDVIFT